MDTSLEHRQTEPAHYLIGNDVLNVFLIANNGSNKKKSRNHKRPPLVSILDQPNPVHIPTSHLLEIHLNITHPSTPRFPQWPKF